jgi:hypothetical protein
MIVLLGTAGSLSVDHDTGIDKALVPVTSFAANIKACFLHSLAVEMMA